MMRENPDMGKGTFEVIVQPSVEYGPFIQHACSHKWRLLFAHSFGSNRRVDYTCDTCGSIIRVTPHV